MGLCILVGPTVVLWSVAVGEEGVEGVSLWPCFLDHGGSSLEGIHGLRVSGRLAVRLVIQLYVGCISPFISSISKRNSTHFQYTFVSSMSRKTEKYIRFKIYFHQSIPTRIQ